MTDHKPLHIKFTLETKVIQHTEEWKNKEDSHGGPAYYPQETVVAESSRILARTELPIAIKNVVRGRIQE